MKRIVLAAALVAAGPATAATITYTASGTGSGTIGSTSFSDASYSITATGDTATVGLCRQPGPIPGCFIVLTSSMDIAIGGLGNYAVHSPAVFFDNNNADIIGFVTGTDASSLNFYYYGAAAPEFATYNAISAIGPLPFYGIPASVDTSGGLLQFIGSAGPATFQAVLTASSVPEPDTWAMMLAGFGLVGLGIRKRKIRTTVRYA